MAVTQERVGPALHVPRDPSELEDKCRLSSQALRRVCSIDHFKFTTTAELPYTQDIIGQPRGVRALEFGIDIDSPGPSMKML